MGKTTIPEDFRVTEEMKAWARTKTPSVNIEQQLEMFVDYWKAHGKKMLDWQATWRNWMRRAPEFAKPVNQYSQMRGVPKVSAPLTPDQEEAYRRRMEAANRDAEAKYGRRQ